MWADLGEPVGNAGKAVGEARERGGCRLHAAGGEAKGKGGGGRRGGLKVSRWPAGRDWSKAAAVVEGVAEGVVASTAKETQKQRAVV